MVNTLENVSPWCSVDTSSGNLTVVLEPFNCFDAELYADELVLDEPVDFREDQRSKLNTPNSIHKFKTADTTSKSTMENGS